MKKSTLFFKVMVLLALLVPWTSWGQDDVSTQSFGGSWHDNSKTKGTLTLTIDGSGNIVDGEYKSSYGGIRAEESVSKGVLSFDLQDWKFAESRNSPVISSSYGWNAQSYFSIKLDGENEGGHETVKISKGQNALSDYNNKYFKIKVTKGGREGNIKVVFKKGQTDISNNLTFSYAEKKGSKPYDGKNISVDEAKDGLTILNNDSEWKGNYTITVEEGKDVGKYDITVTIKTSEYTANKTFTDAYEITPKELTVTIKDQEITLPTESLDTELTSTGADATIGIEGIVNNENVTLSGAIKVKTEGNDKKPGKYIDELISNDIALAENSDVNKNYTLSSTIEAGDLTVKYNLTDENWDDVLDVTLGTEGDGVYTYDGKTHEASITGELADKFEIVYKDAQGNKVEKPLHAGDYNIYIVEKGEGDDNITIPEGGINTKKKITIKAAEITLTGSVTVEQGALLKTEYAVADLDKQNVFGTDDASSKLIEEFGLTFEGKVTPLVDLDLNKVGTTDHAFYIKNATEGTWLINIQESTSENYQLGDITIKDIEIKLIVTEKEVDWTDESNQQKEVTVYVNEEGQLKYGEDGEYSTSVDITLNGISELAGWSFVLEENPEEDFDVLAVMSGDNVVMEGLSWATLITTDKVINGLQVSSENKNSIYERLAESKSVKVRLEKDGADGYLLITFKQGESTEEPGGDDEDMAWADDENKKASITVYVDKSSGQPLKSEPVMDSKGFAIDLTKFEELEGEWSFATTEETKAIIDKDLSALYSFVVFEGDLLLEPQSEFNSESLSSVKVKIENGDNVGYLEINFKTITVIAEDDINKGGDDDNNDGKIDDDKITFVGSATGAENVIYDGLPHGLGMLEITVDGETKVLKETDGAYDVVYGESEEEPVDAGTYSATITFNEAMGYSGTVILENSVKIEKRPLNISFSFSEPIEEGKVPTLDDAEISLGETSLGEGDYLTDCIDVTFRISNEQNADKKYDVYIEHISITNSTSENNGFNPSNYDITIVCKGGVSVKMEDTDGDGVLNDNDEDFNDDSVGDIAVDDIETVDPDTGEGSTGTFYKKYELYLANKDYLKNNEETREHYASEGLELFSRHNKKTTWAGGSFTIWYEHNGEMNEGGYRIFWSNRADGDYKEVKLDEVSGYYQIRNVNSNVYVKLYYETGFPVANEEITATDARAYAQANKIVVITPEPTDVQIISMAGAVVATDQVTGQREFANLAEGVYIVRMGETVIKLQVRN